MTLDFTPYRNQHYADYQKWNLTTPRSMDYAQWLEMRLDTRDAENKTLRDEPRAAQAERTSDLDDIFEAVYGHRQRNLDAKALGRVFKDIQNAHRQEYYAGYKAQAQLRERDAELTALRGALEAILAEPYGCPFCDSGKLRTPANPAKGHTPDCGYELARAALDAAPVANKEG